MVYIPFITVHRLALVLNLIMNVIAIEKKVMWQMVFESQILQHQVTTYWRLPILMNINFDKLQNKDFGKSLLDKKKLAMLGFWTITVANLSLHFRPEADIVGSNITGDEKRKN